ncbi:MAG: serine/threonine protein kinase [Phycisphaerales bacterium]|nr:serine/threonine protein kinase [Phycisphaerales bacterium]
MNLPDDDFTPASLADDELLSDLRVVVSRRTPPADLLVGASIGRYEIRAPLGEGGMARVYRAVDTASGDEVALKVLKPEYQTSPDISRRFAQEAQTMGRIKHAHVARIFDTPEDGSVRAIAMELLPGGSLRDLLLRGAKRRRRLRVTAVVRFMLQAARGLGAAHAVGIVHRDIKPGNLMIDGAGRVKVVDFGVVLALERATWLTGVGKPIGTPAYMSPEQCRGERVCPASDVYALGVSLFELLTGRLPFVEEAASPFALMLKHIQEPPPDPRRLRGRTPDWLAEVVLRCLQKDPKDRFADGAELAKALADQEEVAPPPVRSDKTPAPQRINVAAVREQMQRLPQRAIVAWACRCARRVQQFNPDPRLERSLAMAEEFVYGAPRIEETDTLTQALGRVKRLRNASFRAAYHADAEMPVRGASQAALAAAAASACAAARCAADAAADAAYVAQQAIAALDASGVPLTDFWQGAQRDYHRLLSASVGAEGTVGDILPHNFWPDRPPGGPQGLATAR